MGGRTIVSGEVFGAADSRGGSVIQPGSLYQQALALHQQNRLGEAESLYRQILEVEPNHPGALHFLGMVRLACHAPLEALRYVESSLQMSGYVAVYHNNHGVILRELHRYREAFAAFEQAVALDPGYSDALSNLGLTSISLGLSPYLTEQYFQTALEYQPNHIDALRHFSGFLVKQEQYHDALKISERLAQLIPEEASFEHHLACLYGDCGEIEKAKYHFQRASSLPGGKPVWKWKHLWYSPTFFENETQIDNYWENLNCDLDAALDEKPLYHWPSLPYDGFTHSFHLPHHNRCCKEVLEKFSALFAPSFPFEKPDYRPGEKIRVGFLVTPGHEGGFFRLTTGLIEQLDPSCFEVVVFFSKTKAEMFEGKYERSSLEKIPYSQNFEEAVHTIRAAQCDVIYFWKVGADTWSFFLPMCRLAPVQCTSWSTHGTSGVPQIDYYVSWDKAEIPEAQEHYTENLFLLETTPLYEPFLRNIPPPATRAELDLPQEGAIYFCPHRPPKYHPLFDDYLRQILERDPTGHIVILLGRQIPVAERFAARMKAHLGDDLFRRMIIHPNLTLEQYYRHLSVSSVILNSPVYSGEITTIDGFLYGVPSVAYTGPWIFQRYASAFYCEFGIDGPAVSSKEEYVEQAVRLGTDPAYRRQVSDKILAHRDRFFENEKTVREWEHFFHTVVLQGCASQEISVLQNCNDDPVPMGNLEINVSYGCNLKCRYCVHFCDTMTGFVSLEELSVWLQTWRNKISPSHVRLIGGEPLLHPDLETIIRMVRNTWQATRIDLVTNGLLLSQKAEILHLLRQVGGHVFISRHFNHPEYLQRFELAVKTLQEHQVPFTVYTSDQEWHKYYEYDENNQPVPYESDPNKAWGNCSTKNICPTLLDNQIYKCQHLAYAIRGVRQGILSDAWKFTLDYQPLTPDCSTGAVMQHLASGAVSQCRMCPQYYETVPLDQKGIRYTIRDKIGLPTS